MRTKDLQQFGTALVISGPSGAGKSSVCKKLLAKEENLHFSVSCTTRRQRNNEEDGRDYYFLSREEFDRRIETGEFLEFAEVHGNMYGTLREEVEQYVHQGDNVILDIDVQGARQVNSRIINSMLGYYTEYLFIGPPNFEALEKRLKDRSTDNNETIRQRLQTAKTELQAWHEYTYLVINDDLEEAVEQTQSILRAIENTTVRVHQNPWPEVENYE